MLIFVLGVDGYIGNALTQRLLKEGHTVIGFDNFWRRNWVRNEMGSISAFPILNMDLKENNFNRNGEFSFVELDITLQDTLFDQIVKDYRPDVIYNLAHNPSAPYSMMSKTNAQKVLINNIVGTNNILWSIKHHVPDCHYITIGTVGEYDHYNNLDVEEGYFKIIYKGRTSEELIYPRRPGSIYHCCYDKDTEVLTDNGWKYFKDLSYKDKVATLNKETDTLEYQVPSNIMEYNYDGEMIGIKNKSSDLLVTPNHKIFEHSNHKTPLERWRLTEAKDMYEKNISMRRNVNNWIGKEKEYFTLPSCIIKNSSFSDILTPEKNIPMRNWLNFFGWYITEGSLYKNVINISQKKEYNFDEIIKSFENLGLERKVQTNNSYGKVSGFNIKCSQLSNYLEQFGLSHERFIPKDIKNLPQEQLKILVDVMIKGDGTVNDKSLKFNGSFYTKSKQLADDFQEISIKCGYATLLYEPERSNDNEYVVRLTENNTTQFIMSENDRQKPLYYKLYYNDKVYCCEVPNSIILVRRNGKTIWSGNSKTGSTYLIDYLARAWNLRCTDVMQGIVFGAYTDEINESKIYSRFDFDEAGGTVLNRFCVQAILGIPLTIYGEGEHKRSFLSLNDSIQALMIALENPAENGRVQTWNQLSEWHSMNKIADMVVSAGKEIGVDVEKQHIPTPRVEHTGEHYYNFVTNKLRDKGYKPTRSIDEEIKYVIYKLMNNKKDLEKYKSVVMPKIDFKNV